MKPPHVNVQEIVMELDSDRPIAPAETQALTDLLRRTCHALIEAMPAALEQGATVRADGRMRYRLHFAPAQVSPVGEEAARTLFGKANGKA